MDSQPQSFAELLKVQLQQAEAPGEQAPPSAKTSEVAPEGRQNVSPNDTLPASGSQDVKREPQNDPRLAKLIQQSQQVRAEREAWKKEQEQYKADLAELQQLRELKQRAKEDPVSWAELGGYKPDEYAAALIDKGAMTPERRKIFEQQKELNEMKAWRQSVEEREQKAAQQAQYNQLVESLKGLANDHNDKFDLVKRAGAYDLALQKWQEHYNKTSLLGEPESLPWEYALEQAEEHLLKFYEPVLESPKLKARYGATAPASAPAPTAPAARQRGSINPANRGNSAPPKEMSEVEGLEAAGRLLFGRFKP